MRIAVLLLITAPVFCIDLETARTMALANSRTLARYNLAVESAGLDEKLRKYGALPSLSLGASGSAGLSGEVSLKDSFSAGANFGVSGQLYDGGRNSLLKAVNAMSEGIARQDALEEYFAVLDAADAAYYGVLEAGAALSASDAALEASTFALDMAEIRLESGMIAYGDYLQALAEKESGEASRNQAKRDLTISRVTLANLTGQTEFQEPEELDFEAWEELMRKLAGLSDERVEAFLESFRAEVSRANPALVKAALRSGQADKAVSLAKRDYFPTLNAGVSGGMNYSMVDGADISSGRISLSASIPLDFLVTGANIDKKKIARDEALLDRKSAELALDLEIRTAALDLITQAMSALSSSRAEEYAVRRYEQVLELYRMSHASVAELSDAAASAGSSRNQHIRSRYGFLSGLSKIRSLGSFPSDEELRAALLSW
ncbi:MAG: TolC family protein [Treponema sp.]|nr:TolC family protein [Treponema sp.]